MNVRKVSRYVLGRALVLVCLLTFISFLVFSLQALAPGNTEQVLLGPKPQSPEALAQVRKDYHLDKPFVVQYLIWLENAVTGDLGRSTRTNEPVTTVIRDRVGIDLYLGIYAFVLAIGFGVPLGVLAALRRRTLVDRAVVGASVVGVSAPPFASGLLLLYLFAVFLPWFPAFGSGVDFADRLYHLTLPAIALALTAVALVVKLTRAGMISALEQDYIVFARARGLPGTRSWCRTHSETR